MMRYEPKSGSLYMTELGRIASHFYISHASINTIKDNLKRVMTVQEVFLLIAECAEFESLKVRDEEMPDLEKLRDRSCRVPLSLKEGTTGTLGNRESKVQVLIQVRPHQGPPVTLGHAWLADETSVTQSCFPLFMLQVVCCNQDQSYVCRATSATHGQTHFH